MKALILLLFVSCFATAQDFDTYFQQSKEDFENGIFDSSAFNKAIETCPDINEYPILLVYKGTFLIFNNEQLLAAKYAKLALSLSKTKEDRFEALELLGFVYSSTDDTNQTLKYNKESLVLAKELGYTDRIDGMTFNILLQNYSLAVDKKEFLDQFLQFYNNLPQDKELSERLAYMTMIVDLSNGDLLKEQYIELKESLNISNEKEELNPMLLGQYYHGNTILESYLGNFETALKYCDSSYAISKKHLNKERVLNDFYTYKTLYQTFNKNDIALKYADSILDIEKSFKTQEFESGLEIIDENILFKKIEKQTTKKNSFLNTLLIIAGAIILIVIFLLIYSKRTRRKLQSALNFNKNKYNDLWANYQLSNKQLEKLKEELVKQSRTSDENGELNTLLKELSIHLNTNKDDEHKHINMLKDKFVNSLQNKAPYLNNQEQLICFFINLNLSHKKIAELLSKTEKSIDSYKYRINTKVKQQHNTTVDQLFTTL